MADTKTQEKPTEREQQQITNFKAESELAQAIFINTNCNAKKAYDRALEFVRATNTRWNELDFIVRMNQPKEPDAEKTEDERDSDEPIIEGTVPANEPVQG
jgi:hypothetical protein